MGVEASLSESEFARYRTRLRIGNVPLASRFSLAPLAGYTNLPFRLNVREVAHA
jgi:hypothetical protein